jgi:hypothetical protein
MIPNASSRKGSPIIIIIIIIIIIAISFFVLSASEYAYFKSFKSELLGQVSRSRAERSGWKTISVFVGNSTYGKPKAWNSQVGQDQTIARIFGGKKNGFFVDLAANDAVELSNTLSLEQTFNWKGLCIEANSEYMWGLAHRKCRVVWAVTWNITGGIVEFAEHPQSLPGVLGGVVSSETDNKPGRPGTITNFPTTSLEDIFTYSGVPSVIDYFSFDIEGAEAIVLQNFPMVHIIFTPRIIQEGKDTRFTHAQALCCLQEKYTFLTLTVERPSPVLVNRLVQNDYVYVKVVISTVISALHIILLTSGRHGTEWCLHCRTMVLLETSYSCTRASLALTAFLKN